MNKICLGHFTSLKICSNGNLTVTYLLVDRLKAKRQKVQKYMYAILNPEEFFRVMSTRKGKQKEKQLVKKDTL